VIVGLCLSRNANSVSPSEVRVNRNSSLFKEEVGLLSDLKVKEFEPRGVEKNDDVPNFYCFVEFVTNLAQQLDDSVPPRRHPFVRNELFPIGIPSGGKPNEHSGLKVLVSRRTVRITSVEVAITNQVRRACAAP
jgi:hypothetical protein